MELPVWFIVKSPIFMLYVSLQENTRRSPIWNMKLSGLVLTVISCICQHYFHYIPEVSPWVWGTQRFLPQFHFQRPSLVLVCLWCFCTLCSQLQICFQFSVYSSSLFSLPLWSSVFPKVIGCLWTVVSVSDLVCDYFTYGQLFWYFSLLKMKCRKTRNLVMPH